MEGEAAAAVLQVLVQNLIDHSKKEISLIRGLDKDAAELAGNLDMIQKFLNDAEMRSIRGGAVKSWLRKLEDAAFDADNVLDEVNYHLLSKKIKKVKPVKEKVLSCFSAFNHHIERPRKMALRIKQINYNLDSINKNASNLGLVARFNEASTLVDASLETASFTVDPIFIGRDDDVSKLVEMLTASSVPTEEPIAFSIFSIVGMGGLGKTTLTRKVFHHQKVKHQFGLLIWVHVSQNFDPLVLYTKILKELTYDQLQAESKQDALKRLRQALKDKTYLLVLDDVWNTDPQEWEDFMNSLLGVTSSKGNAIVVTTRSMEVASIVNSLHTHELKGLSEEDCWSIIEGKLFGKEDDVSSELETIGRKIARRCQGLPLAANVVGGILSNNKSEEKWILIEQKWLSHDEGEKITKILRLTFDYLSPPSLKKCFAYCSMFPKGYTIKKQELIEYWMAEGFLEANGSKDNMESAGDRFINILLHNSLLQVARRDDYGNVESCVMHDLVHDLASSVLVSSDNADGNCRVRYMFLNGKASPIPKQVTADLRTLFVKGEISSIMLSDLECLRVLRLASSQVMPESIRKLIHLRSLDISNTRIKILPGWIGELYHLQTLRAEKYLRKVPNTLKYLINLRHLYINSNVRLPAEIGRLTSLQTLTHFEVRDKKGCTIEELGSLNNLKGGLQIRGLELVGNKEEAEKANLLKKIKILELWLKWDRFKESVKNNYEDVLEGLQPHPKLKKLVIEGFKGTTFPSWTSKMAVRDVPQGSWVGLNMLTEVRLIDCSKCEEIPMLGHLPSLKSLELKGLSEARSMKQTVNKTTRVSFPALERLEMDYLPKLEEWAEVEFAEYSASGEEVKLFPRLRYLRMSYCKKLMRAPSSFSLHLEHLKLSCMPMDNIFHSKTASLTNLSLAYIDDLKFLPNWLLINNPNLSVLEINSCPELRELPQGLERLDSLVKLTIRNCPNLERIAADDPSARSFASLCRVKIEKCGALACLPCGMVGPSLRTLWLGELGSLENVSAVIACLPRSPLLTSLYIAGVPNCTATGCIDYRPLLKRRD